MSTLTLAPGGTMNVADQHSGPTFAHKASAFVILVAASVAFAGMVLWPLVTRFV